MAQRIQRQRTRGWRMGDAVYVGRGSRWGNPFKIGPYTRDEVVELYGDMMDAMRKERPEQFQSLIEPLRGKDLACWCSLDQPCHANVLLELANEAEKSVSE